MEGGEAGGAHDLRNVSLVGLGFFAFLFIFWGRGWEGGGAYLLYELYSF